VEDYYDDAEMPGSQLNIRFHGNRGASKQIFMIPFREGDDVKYFVVRGVCEGDRRVTGCDIIRIMNWDQLIKYLGEVWDEMWGAMLFKLKAADAVEPRLIIDDVGCIWRVGSVMQGGWSGWMRSLLRSSGG
jgi:hypothetical protein